MPDAPPVPEPTGRLLGDLLAVGEAYSLVLAGGYAALAHGLVERTGPDVDVATEHPVALEVVADAVRGGLVGRGWMVQTLEAGPLSAQFLVTDAPSGVECEVALHKEMLWRPPVDTELGPALSLDDLVGTGCGIWPTAVSRATWSTSGPPRPAGATPNSRSSAAGTPPTPSTSPTSRPG